MAPRTLPSLATAAATAILLLVLAAVALPAPVAANQDGDALIALKNGLRDPNGELNNWDPDSIDPCAWSLVECDHLTKRVIRLWVTTFSFGSIMCLDLHVSSFMEWLGLCTGHLNIRLTYIFCSQRFWFSKFIRSSCARTWESGPAKVHVSTPNPSTIFSLCYSSFWYHNDITILLGCCNELGKHVLCLRKPRRHNII